MPTTATYKYYPRVTAHLKGILRDPMNQPMAKAIIVVEATGENGENHGLTAKHVTDAHGRYSFAIRQGYNNIYVMSDPDAVQVLQGTVYISNNDFNKLYTLEELLDK